MSQKDVKLSFNSSSKHISVDKEKIQVKQNDDTVQWSGAEQFTIVMPTQSITSSASGGKWLAVGGPWSSVGTIKYDVTASGYNDLDPEIEVQP